MKLHKLRLKNIASLRGEHEINFDEIQRESSLFAITGETGAGKSTILNSIGLVLYGKVYKTSINQNDVVTLGEKEGQIELVFEAKGTRYYGVWRAKIRKQNGELYATPQLTREMYELDGVDFDSSKVATDKKADEILNLNFDQYCKCVILNQGEFSKFLSSSFSDRKEILEKLYPGELLDNLSRTIRQEVDELKKEKNELEIERSTLQSEGHDPKVLALKKIELKTQVETESERLKTLEEANFIFTSLVSYHLKYQDTQNKIKNLKSSLSLETEKLNHFLIQSKNAQEALSSSEENFQKRSPRLQELIKFEETLLIHNKEIHTLKTKDQALSLDLKNGETEMLEVNKKISSHEVNLKELTLKLTHPMQDLRRLGETGPQLIDSYSKFKLLQSELNSKKEALKKSEADGKVLNEERTRLKGLLEDVTSLKNRLKELTKNKEDHQKLSESKQKAQILDEELSKKLTVLEQHIEEQNKELTLKDKKFKELQSELAPIELAIQSSELEAAISLCLSHTENECPVCHNHVSNDLLKNLKAQISKINVPEYIEKKNALIKNIHSIESGLEYLRKDLLKSTLEKTATIETKTQNLLTSNEKLPSITKIDEEIQFTQKKIWDQEKIEEDLKKLELNLDKERQNYSFIKKEVALKEESSLKLETALISYSQEYAFFDFKDDEKIEALKLEIKNFQYILTEERALEKNQLALKHLVQKQNYLKDGLKENQERQNLLQKEMTSISTVLRSELKDSSASELLKQLSIDLKTKNDELRLKQSEQKEQEKRLTEIQSRMYELDQLIKDADFHYTNENHKLKNFNGDLKIIGLLKHLTITLSDSHDLFIPLKDLMNEELTVVKSKFNELKMDLATVLARLEDSEKKADRLALLKLKLDDIQESFSRKNRLSEILGKDDLRTFVLSLVEENLIIQTNEELKKLCNNRYEIIHQSRKMKLTPEFYILDKFREGGLRKVSTLSGGETFMVSLAMAIGLAEMTRGTAEIDSLFIDEGFGTLDQDSLEDVIDMLKQIQTRGLLVGIISHVKALTQSLPVNLEVYKKSDGTSNLKIVHN